MSNLETLLEQMQQQIDDLERRVKTLETAEYGRFNYLYLTDGTDAPSAVTDWAIIYIDATDGDLKIIFEDSTVKTITVDT